MWDQLVKKCILARLGDHDEAKELIIVGDGTM